MARRKTQREKSINQSINQSKVRAPKKLVLLSLSSLLWLAAGAHIQISKLLHWISVVKGRRV
jgi:hypothetical protein